MKTRYRKVLVVTGLLFVLSFLLAGVVALFVFEDGPTNVDTLPQQASNNLVLVALISMFTSIGSAIAFISTLVFSWTKERRERAMFAMDAERKKLENEKLMLELEQMRRSREG